MRLIPRDGAFTLTCRCGSTSRSWEDHAPRCPFAIYGVRRAQLRRQSRRLWRLAALEGLALLTMWLVVAHWV